MTNKPNVFTSLATRLAPRRRFLKAAGSAAAAALTAPAVLTGRAAGPILIGAGEHTYEVTHDWARLPEGRAFGYTHGVIVDGQGRVFIHNQSEDAVSIFDPEGRFVRSWGPEFKGGAHGMQYSREGGDEFLYLSDIGRKQVIKTTLDGEIVWTIGCPMASGVYDDPGKFVPTNTAVAPNGDVYVADGYGQSWVHQFNARAEYIRTWGGKGSEAGRLDCPHGIWIDTRSDAPRVVVADRSNRRLQYFSLDGRHEGFVTDDLRHPCHFDQRGEELLIPDLHGRVTILDRDNRLIVHLGDYEGVEKLKGYPNLPREERPAGRFISPHDACWDAAGNIYVVEWIRDGRVTKLRRAG